jgi:hypothetical protein
METRSELIKIYIRGDSYYLLFYVLHCQHGFYQDLMAPGLYQELSKFVQVHRDW